VHEWTQLSLPDDPGLSAALIRLLVLTGVFILMLAVVAVGLALAGKDSEDERQVLAAIGAAPRTLRRVGALRGALLVGVAVVLAIPAGVLPMWSIKQASGDSQSAGFAVDWPTLAFLVLVVPVATGLVVWFAGRLRDLVKPTRPAVFDFAE
jgi:putative ABC transport system permease protein